MPSPGNRLCANCIGTLSFPIGLQCAHCCRVAVQFSSSAVN